MKIIKNTDSVSENRKHNRSMARLGAKLQVESYCEPGNTSADEITVEMNDTDCDIGEKGKYDVIQNSLSLTDKLNKLKPDLEQQQEHSKPSLSIASSGQSSSVSLAPKWVYGTTLPPVRASTNSYSSTSGLCLSERGQVAVAQPEVIQNHLFPTTVSLQQKIIRYRENIGRMLSQDVVNDKDNFKNPLLIIAGPRFITDPNQAKACAQWVGGIIGKEFNNLPSSLCPENVLNIYQRSNKPMLENVLMSLRTNLTKYSHSYNDPSFVRGFDSVMKYEVEQGIPICRALLCELAEICPIVGEISDTITPQYFSDLFCLGIVSSTMSESQLHRELVSGVSYPVGFHTLDSNHSFDKEMYTHKITSSLDAMYASSQPHQFLSVTKIGTVAVVGTIGNDEAFIILQVNLELDYSELEYIIKQVYDYSSLNMARPKIMLDIGKISNQDFKLKRDLLRQLFSLDDDIKFKIIGVLIDSGDNYIPHNYTIDLYKPFGFNDEFENLSDSANSDIQGNLTDHDDSENIMNRQKLIGLNNDFVKNRIYKNVSSKESGTLATKTMPDSDDSLMNLETYYEYFINADKMIWELESISSLRNNHRPI